MKLIIQNDYEAVSRWAAEHIALRIRDFERMTGKARPFVLGLPTGSTPLGTYRELIAMCKAGKISFKNVTTFNMDEYVGLNAGDEQSYRHFMNTNLFKQIDIDLANTHVLDGMTMDVEAECRTYEDRIKEAGGIDLFLGGMGEDGHVAFNEPGSSLHSRTRCVALNQDTIEVNAGLFFNGDTTKVPRRALTVGVGTVLDAREVVILVTGRRKARALAAVVEGGVTNRWTLSALQMHNNAVIVCDEEACGELTYNTVKYYKNMR
jgi:glucosamine-6-phosphate deaminase